MKEESKEVETAKEESDKPTEEKESTEEKPSNDGKAKQKKNPNPNNRILKGVMRVGPLCTGLLLKGQLAVNLVVLCAG